MKSYIGLFIGLLLSVSSSAESLLEGRVRLESGQPAVGVQVRLFDLTNLHQSVGTTTDETGHFTLSLPAAAPGSALPQGFALGQNYPNPFNPSTIIPYQIPTAAHVRLAVFNLLGQRIATLVDGERPAGFNTATWYATDGAGRAIAAGVYIYRMTVGVESQTGRMVLVDGQAGVSAAGTASVLSGVSGGGADGAESEVYGLIVSGEGLAPYVDSSFRVEAGMAPVELVVSSGHSGAAADDDCDLCDLFDALHDEEEGPGPRGKAQAALEAPAAPTNLRFDAPTDSSCTVRWDASDGATDYDVNYKPAVGGRWTNEPHRGIRLYNTIDDLQSGTEYRWAVRAENGEGRSAWVFGPNFTTLEKETDETTQEEAADGQAPAAPTNLRFDAPTDSSCTVRWDAAVGATDYDVNYKPAVGGRWTNEPHRGTGLSNTIDDLQSGTEYRWAVRAENGEGRSAWVFGPNFTTLETVSGQETTPEEEVSEQETTPEEDSDAPVIIPDPNLRLLIEALLSREPEMGGIGRQKARGAPILKAEMEKLRSVFFRGLGYNPSSFGLTQNELDRIRESGIKDWTGIEHATSLTRLVFTDVDLSEADLSPLAGLSRLNFLNLSRTKISDLSPLVGLQLRTADFSGNNISDISPLLKIMVPDRYGVGPNEVHLYANPLSRESINTHIPALRNMGIPVEFSTIVSSQQIYNDNVFVLPIAENLAAGNLPLADYSAHLYEYFSDQFDFLIFIPNLNYYQKDQDGWNFYGRYNFVYNDLKGIGQGTYFVSEYGSAQKLQGVIELSETMNDLPSEIGISHFLADGSPAPPPRTPVYSGPFLHELMHRWANYIIEPEGHWTWNSANGILGGFDIATLVDHGNGRYSANGSVPGYDGFSNGGWAGNFIPYSPIELYLAGLIPPEEVPDLWVAGEECIGVVGEDGYWDNESFITHQVRTYTIEDIIAEHGPRIPNHTQSQKNFRAAVILLISEDYPADTRVLDTLSEDVASMSYAGYDQDDEFYNFYEATGGRATLTMDGLSSLKRQGAAKRLVPSSYGTPPPIVDHYHHRDGPSHTPKKEK